VGEFGDKFRKAREKKELSLDDVSNVTKISTRMLQAIEEEHFDLLPGGVFNRGFIRAYAKHLGLDSEDAVNDYLTCLRQAQVDSHIGWDATERRDPHAPVVTTNAKLPPSIKPEVKVQAPIGVEELPELQLPRAEHVNRTKKEYLGRSAGISWIRIALATCLLISLFFLWTRHSRNSRTAGASNGSTGSAPSSTVAAAPVSGTPASQSSAPPSSAAAPSPRPSTESAPRSPEAHPAADRASAPVPPAATSADPNAVKVEKKGDVTIRSFGATAANPAEKPAATLKLIVRASENSWISVTSDGQLVTQETLIAPAATSFHATRELVVRVGNAAGVSFLWNGEELPAQGAEAEAKTFIFDAQGMRVTAPQAPQP
jgi:cytoskeleton protein RodZ